MLDKHTRMSLSATSLDLYLIVFIFVSAENAVSHKCVVANGNKMFTALLDNSGYSVHAQPKSWQRFLAKLNVQSSITRKFCAVETTDEQYSKTSTLREVQNSWRNYTRTRSTTKRHQQKACRAKLRQHFHAMHWDWVTDLCVQIWKHMGRKLLKTVQTITTFRNPLADPVGTCRGPPLVRGPQFENRWSTVYPRCSLGRASIDRRISHPPGPQQQTRYTLLQWVNGTGKFVCLRIFNEKNRISLQRWKTGS